MTVPGQTLQREVEELVREQICALKQDSLMNNRDIFEFHLRHYQIMMFYRWLDRSARLDQGMSRGWLS